MDRDAQHVRRIDAMEANAMVAIADIERGAFVELFDDLTKHRRYEHRRMEMPLIKGTE